MKSTPTTQLVSEIVFSDGRTISYEYDAEERITKVVDSVDGTTEYTYDALGQLIVEKKNGAAVNFMSYDNYGNIKTKNGTAYTYGDSVWKDLLTKVGTQTITYDKQGNPTKYLGHTLTWEKGRQLKFFDKNKYTYNANGIRTSKTVGVDKHTYTLEGAKILREVWGSNTLIPLYDNEDSVCGIIYNDEPYYFQKNLQGDIIGIVDKDAEVVARYSYDAWGVCTIAQDTSGCGIATVNPFRYRGYYFDTEIEMYYLQSRYYDPVVGRFINADDPVLIIFCSDSFDVNWFIYCKNSPHMYVDYSGYAETYTYEGIKCEKNSKGFDVPNNPKFCKKSFCRSYAKAVISKWGSRGKYCNMDELRIAKEIFAHEIAFVIGWKLKISSTALSLANVASHIKNILTYITAFAAGKVSDYLIERAKLITVNNDEKWYRLCVYELMWTLVKQ